MRLLPVLLIAAALIAAPNIASATYYQLVSCNYKYIPEFGTNKWVGVYESQYGNLFTAYFDSYCPQVINQ